VATVDPLSVYHGAKIEHNDDFPDPAVPVRKIARNEIQISSSLRREMNVSV
jgi:hypothetical protein